MENTDAGRGDERARLVRLCAHLTGDREAAEDLAQEALLVAWRDAGALRDPLARERWLRAIARNLCRDWLRARGRARLRMMPGGASRDGDATDTVAAIPDDVDLEIALERQELADLLDRALALLPAAAREVLVARHVAGSAHAAIAARLGISEKAVAMRLARGKLLLRRALATDLRAEAAAYGLAGAPEEVGWQETRIWCPNCGRRRLTGL